MSKKAARYVIGLLGQQVPALVKEVSVEHLLLLMADASRQGFSATGRPAWVERNTENIAGAVLMPLGAASAQAGDVQGWRCYAGVVVKGKGPAVFTVDVSTESFSQLEDISDAWDLSKLLLYHSLHVSIDEDSSR
jgi:hypothetical protein